MTKTRPLSTPVFWTALFADINTSTASFSLSNLLATGPAQVAPGPVVIQDYQGGSYSLYAPNNALLLSGTLTDSVLTGTLGPPGTGAVITTVLGAVTGGSLQPYVLANSVALSMNLTSINGGAGLTLDPNNMLQPFSADAFVNITADPSHLVPEPASLLLVLAGVTLGMAFGRRSANRL